MKRYRLKNGRRVGKDYIYDQMEDIRTELKSVESMLFTLALSDIDSLGAEHVGSFALALVSKVSKATNLFDDIHITLIDGVEALDKE